MRLVGDTNVVASALLWGGIPGQLLHAAFLFPRKDQPVIHSSYDDSSVQRMTIIWETLFCV